MKDIKEKDYVKFPVRGGMVYGQVMNITKTDDDKTIASVELPFNNGVSEHDLNGLEKIDREAYDEYIASCASTDESVDMKSILEDKENKIKELEVTVAELKESSEKLNETLCETKAALEKSENEVKELRLEKIGTERFNELASLKALKPLGLDDSQESRNTIANMDESVYESTVKMAKSLLSASSTVVVDDNDDLLDGSHDDDASKNIGVAKASAEAEVEDRELIGQAFASILEK